METRKKYEVTIADPFGLVTPEHNDNSFTVQYLDSTISKKGEEYFLMKVNIPFNMNKLVKDNIMRDDTLSAGKYRRLKEYEDFKVEYVVAAYRNKMLDRTTFNIAYIPNELIAEFKNIDSIYNKLKGIILGSIKEV